jgi:PKD repeat protein
MTSTDRVTHHRKHSPASIAALTVAALVVITAGVALAPTGAAALLSTPAPVSEPTANNVTADALPTVQINGVVWAQAIVGNTVYAGGNFSNARPAGSAAGKNIVTRNNLLSYTLSTGVLNTSFAPSLNGQVKTVVASPDGSRVYVGGQFTTVSGVTRNRIAAFSTATGALISTFAPSINYTVNSIVATNSTVYVGGAFSGVGATSRTRLAAFSAANGALLAWHPIADATVLAMVLTPNGSKVIVGGAFAKINGTLVYGLGALDANSAAVLPWAANALVRDYGTNSALNSLSVDGNAVYGSGYAFYAAGGAGTLEGAFSANPDTGQLNWVEDCHGDSYGTHSANGVVYVVTHAHFCTNVGGYPDTNPRVGHRALAFTDQAVGTLKKNSAGTYTNWGGTPAPSLFNWFPDLDGGSFTGQSQAAWDITGNGQYVIMGGEFPKVNGVAQQGIVRFAVRPTAPGVQGPRVAVVPTLTALSNTSVRINWQTSWDRDNQNLTYKVIRNDNVAAPVATINATSQFWNRPSLSFTNSGLGSGTHYNYKVYVVDPFGNTLQGTNVGITTGGAAAPAGNQAPTAAFSQTCTDLSCSFSSGSSDDGSITGYAWDFGDGATATDASPSHTYASDGTRTVTLTVTDNDAQTGGTSHSVTVSSGGPPPVGGGAAADDFARTTSNGWGSADTGGAWTIGGTTASNFSVDGGAGQMRIPTGGTMPTAYLNGVSLGDSNSVVDFTFDKALTGSEYEYAYIAARHSGTSQYRLRTKLLGTTKVQLSLTKVVSGIETVLATSTISGISFAAGQHLRMRLEVSGTSSVSLAGKLWLASASEPAAAQVTSTDAASPLGAGTPGLAAYLVGGSANAPVVAQFMNFDVTGP